MRHCSALYRGAAVNTIPYPFHQNLNKRRAPMNWEPWTGCYKISDGCTNCYFYGPHAKRFGQNTIQKPSNSIGPSEKKRKRRIQHQRKQNSSDLFCNRLFPSRSGRVARGSLVLYPGTAGHRVSDPHQTDRPVPVSLPADWGRRVRQCESWLYRRNPGTGRLPAPAVLSYPIKRRFIACAPLLRQSTWPPIFTAQSMLPWAAKQAATPVNAITTGCFPSASSA